MLDAFLQRLSRLAAGLTVAMSAYLVEVITFSLHPYMDDDPVAFCGCVCVYNGTMPAITAFSVLMLRPRRANQATTMKRIGPVLINK